MKKHFLLFALMALLPLAAWAVAPNPADLVTKPSLVAGLIYNGTEQALTTGSYSLPADYDLARGGVEWAVTTTAAEPTSSSGKLNAVAKNAGKYYVWYKVKADGDVYNVDSEWKQIGGSFVRISQKTLNIYAHNQSKTYGEADPELTYTPSGLISPDVISGALSRADGNDVNTYEITQGSLTAGNNYFISYTSALLTINKREVTLTWSTTPLIYNKQAQAPTATAGNLVYNDAIAVTVTGQQTAAGENYEATASALTGDKKANYKLPTTVTQTYFIGQKEVGLTWTNTELTYNKTAQKPTATASGVEDGDEVNVTVDGAETNVGNYTAEATELSNANYKLPENKTKAFTIGQKTLTITAADRSKTYGESDPALTYISDGLVAGDEITGELTRVAGETVGTYAINQGTLDAGGNYSIAYTGADLTIDEREVTLTWTNTSLTYTGSAQKPTATAGNLAYNDVITVTVTGEQTAAGNYTATASDLTGDMAANYVLPTTVTQDFTIGDAGVTITAHDQEITYGESIDASSSAYTATGLQEGHSVKSVTLTPSTTDATQNGTIIPSAIVIVDGNNNEVTGNYTITPVNGTLIINQKDIDITTVISNAKTYGYTLPTLDRYAFGFSHTTLKDGDAIETLNFTVTQGNAEYVKDDLLAAGQYTVTPATVTIKNGNDDVTNNYSVTFNYATLDVNPAAITLTAEDQTIAQGGSISNTTNDVTLSSGSLVGNDTMDDLNIELSKTKTAVGVWPGDITITTNNANYDVTTVPGKLTITAAAGIALTGADTDYQLIKDYGGQNVNVTINLAARNGRNLGGVRNWVKENWVTLTLPFDITVAKLSEKLGYALVNEIDPSRTEIDVNGSKVYGKLTMKGAYGKDYLPANKPLLVKIADDIANTGNNGVIDFGPQKIIAPATEEDLTVSAGQGVKFIGTYASKTVTSTDNENIWFMIGGGYTQWAYITSTSGNSWTIKPFEAFIDMSDASQPVHAMTFYFEEFDGSTTAIRSVDADNLKGKMNAEGWYTLNGVKLQNAPTQKGVYIKDGKKVVIK